MIKFMRSLLLSLVIAILLPVTSPLCSNIPMFRNLRMTCTRGRRSRSVCFFSCSGGSLINSRSTRRQCNCHGSICIWSGPLAMCTRTKSSPSLPQLPGRTQNVRPSPPATRPTATTKHTIPTTTNKAFPDFSADNNCPVPQFGTHSLKVLDRWPRGGVFRVNINKSQMNVGDGWSVILRFSREIPGSAEILSWNSQVVSVEGKYLALSNVVHNANLTGHDSYSFTFVLNGASLRKMSDYSALVGFYTERVENVSCNGLANNNNHGSLLQPESASKRAQSQTTSPSTTISRQTVTRKSTPPARTRRPSRSPPATTKSTTPRITKSTRLPPSTTTRPVVRPTSPPATKRPSRRPPATRPPTRTRTNPPPAIRTTPANRGPPSSNQPLQINEAAVERHRGSCNVLSDPLQIENPGYEVKTGDGPAYRFNADIVISGQQNMLNDWSLKVVFSKEITSIEVSEAQVERRSTDGRVYIFRPHPSNIQLRDDFSFRIVAQMRTQTVPLVVMFLCPSGVTPNLSWNGIFRPSQPQGQQNSTNGGSQEEREQRLTEKERQQLKQEQLARERKKQEETRKRQARLERERSEREQARIAGNNRNQRNSSNNNSNQNSNRNQTNKQNQNNQNKNKTLTPPSPSRRPRPSASNRCRGPAGRLAVRPRQTRVKFQRSPVNERKPYDYNELIAKSILFYEAQRSGPLPSFNRIPWRGDSGLKDGCDVGRDLTGGWYDAGDHVKFGFPMAWSATTLAWGVIEFKEGYEAAGEYRNVLNSLKWATDYFIKAHAAKYVLYGQVGNGVADHRYWGRPEQMSMARPSYKITQRKPGSDLAGETAAALAASSIVFRKRRPKYADLLVRHARELYDFANRYRGLYHNSIRGAKAYYRSNSGYNDELIWGALWLYRATGQRSYLQAAKRKYRLFGGGGIPKVFSWDDKRAGCQVLMANITGESQYINHVIAYQRFLKNAPKTPRGMTWLKKWGSNRYAANGAFIALAASKIPTMPNKQTYINYARSQIHYMLGGAGRSYVVGYGRNPPKKPHHRGSSCPAPPGECSRDRSYLSNANNPYTLYGALVAGPAKNGTYTDDRKDQIMNEVATDYNAGFQGALAGLKYYKVKARRS